MKRSSPWLTALLQMMILLTVVAYATPWLVAAESALPTPRRAGDIGLRGFQARPIFNGSVVPGGLYSRDELRAAIARDAVVADHYREAHLDDMHVETLTAGRAAYVSYRRGGRVYWTRERVWLKAGETVLTDGTTMIRARCGNCISNVKQDNVAAVEPAHGELDDFVVPPTPDTSVDLLAPDAEAELGDLLEVPFMPQTLAVLGPEDGFPFVLPPLVLPPSGGRRGSPAGFVPPGGSTGGTTSGTSTTGATTGDVTSTGSTTDTSGTDTLTTGTPWTDTLTTGTPATGSLTTGVPVDDTTPGSSTGTATGSPTTDTSSGPTTGSLTGGIGFPSSTTVGPDTPANGARPAPEPGVLWLVTAGIIGLASRRVRRR